jgi:peptidyl-prolyl cis-trans isomerase D
MALAFLRRHQRWFHVLLGLVILGFIVFYIPILRDAAMGSTAEEVGRVADRPITVREFQTAYQRMRRYYEQMAPGRVDARMLRMLGIDRQVFDDLVEQRVVEIEAERLGLEISHQDIEKAVTTHPAFQEQGRFIGGARVKQFLEMQGQTVDDLERMIRQTLARKQLEALVTDAVSLSPSEVEQEYRRRNEEIKAEYVLVESAKFQSQAPVTDEDVRTLFEANKQAYLVPEKRIASYIAVDPATLRSQVTVTDADVEGYYRANAEEFKTKDEVCAQHILVKVKGEADKDGRTDEQAKKLAGELLAQVRGGADFASLAKKSSDDPGSAAQGGDLSCFGRGSMVNEFENVAFSLKAGEISEPVKTTYGYHIIKVNEHREEKQRPIEEVRDSVRAQLMSQRVQTKAEEISTRVSAVLSRGAKLEDAAKADGLKVETSAPVGRGESGGPFGENAVSRLFDLKAGEVSSEPLPMREGFVFVSVKEVKPSHLPDLAEVQEQVKADVAKKRVLEEAQARAAELKTKAQAGGLDKAASALGLVRKETPAFVKRGDPLGEVPSGLALEEAAFGIPVGTLSDPIPVATGYVVLRVREKKAFDPAAFEKEKAQLTATLRSERRRQLFEAYLAQARQRVTIERRTDVLSRYTS